MNGTLNGIHLHDITSCMIAATSRGTILSSFQVADHIPALDAVLRLNAPILLILSDKTLEGTIVSYSANLHAGYEVTIESKSKSPSGPDSVS